MIRGLRFFERTNMVNTFLIASYHHPRSITWRWAIYLDRKDTSFRFRFGPGYSMGKKYYSPNGEFSLWVGLWLIGTISLNIQKHMWIDEARRK